MSRYRTTHTEGPWEIKRFDDGDDIQICGADNGSTICDLADADEYVSLEETVANALVLAAAVDALEACEKIAAGAKDAPAAARAALVKAGWRKEGA
jgi:hypothetical protein